MSTTTPQKKKNILMILVDQARTPMHFPASGLDLPAYTWLKKRGVSFTNYYVNTAPCTPSRSVIFTGWHTARNGMIDNLDFPYVGPMDESIATLGDMAAAAGYYSVYKGKWHLARITQKPEDAAETAGQPADEERHTTEDDMLPYGFHDYQHSGDLHSIAREGYTHDDHIVSDTIYWLKDWVNYRTDESRTTPFFMVCALVNPHDVMTIDVGPGQVQKKDKHGEIFMEIMPPPEHAIYTTTHQVTLPPSWYHDYNSETYQRKPAAHREADRINSATFGWIHKKEDAWKNLVNYYINCHRDVDRQIQRLIDHLEETGLLQDTIIIFTSDHGELGGAHGMRNKGPYIYEENNHVPLVICHPNGLAGATNPSLCSALDLAPTLMGLCAGDPSTLPEFPHIYGEDLSRAVFEGEFRSPRDAILFTYTSLCYLDAEFVIGDTKVPNPNKRGLLHGIRTSTHKFARYFSPLDVDLRPTTIDELRRHFDLELYDLTDPNEIENLANDPANEALILELNAKLNEMIADELRDLPPRELPPLDAIPRDIGTFRALFR